MPEVAGATDLCLPIDVEEEREVYGRYFGQTRPARYCVKAELVNPDWLVEIASIAVIGPR